MGYIDTDIKTITVEIEDKEYPVAAKTVEIADRLAEAAKKCAGQPEYKLWLAELDVLLGKAAVKELFSSGRNENIDRIQRIHAGVLRAFEYNASALQEEETQRQQELIAPLTELLRQISAMNRADNKRIIHRG